LAELLLRFATLWVNHRVATGSPLAKHATEVEPLLVANGDTIVASIQVGRFFPTGADNTGWATSKDAGKTWKHGFLDGITLAAGGTWTEVSLPTVAFDHKHRTYLIASMPLDAKGTGAEFS
jgi:hypothetical protein